MSVYNQRKPDDVFYMSKGVNTYFTENFYDYAKKVKILQPKLKCRNNNTINTIKQIKLKNIEMKNAISQYIYI